MSHDPALISETKAWFKKAAIDLRAAEHNLGASPPLLEDTLFHCQQTAEKAMKGFLVWHGSQFRKVHSLEEIGEQCLEIDPALRPLIDQAVPLTQYAWEFRYPGEPEEPTREETEDALRVARQVYESMLAPLPNAVVEGVPRY